MEKVSFDALTLDGKVKQVDDSEGKTDEPADPGRRRLLKLGLLGGLLAGASAVGLGAVTNWFTTAPFEPRYLTFKQYTNMRRSGSCGWRLEGYKLGDIVHFKDRLLEVIVDNTYMWVHVFCESNKTDLEYKNNGQLKLTDQDHIRLTTDNEYAAAATKLKKGDEFIFTSHIINNSYGANEACDENEINIDIYDGNHEVSPRNTIKKA